MFSDPMFPLLGRNPGQIGFDIPARRTVGPLCLMNTFNELPAQITQNTESGRQLEINAEDETRRQDR